jgi:hypothetical protein
MPPRSILWGMLVANLCGVAVAILVAVVLSLDQPGGLLALTRAEVAWKIVVPAVVVGFSVVVAVTLLLARGLRR